MNEQLDFLKAQITLLEKRINACSGEADSKEYAILMRLYLAAVKEYNSLCAKEEQPQDSDPLLAFANMGD
ncbi:MAG: hypothetical protein LUG23_01975 [Oscillospiraceae bacterium]|nr:hypothetical protein [Oscillospiraceae bacterium]